MASPHPYNHVTVLKVDEVFVNSRYTWQNKYIIKLRPAMPSYTATQSISSVVAFIGKYEDFASGEAQTFSTTTLLCCQIMKIVLIEVS